MWQRCLVILCLLLATLVSKAAYADIVTLTGTVMRTDSVESGSWGVQAYVSPLMLHDVSGVLEDDIIGFCGDRTTLVSRDFQTKGQEYYWASLGDVPGNIYDTGTRNSIQELFDHTYGYAFSVDGILLDLTVVQALQLALWKIISPEYPILAPSNYSYDLTEQFLTALNGGDWADVQWNGKDFTENFHTDILVFWTTPTKTSQTMISASYGMGNGFNMTPEPATLAIFGFGFFGVGFTIRRRFQKIV